MEERKNRTAARRSVTVIGAGASGMTAALTAARGGCQVTIIDRNQRPGKKLSATGNGKCNFTNAEMGPERYRGGDPAAIARIIGSFGTSEAVGLFRSLGIEPAVRNGYYYPASLQASSVCQAFSLELKRYGVTVISEVAARSAGRIHGRFCVQYMQKDGTVREAASDALILSCGSPAGVSVPKRAQPVTGYAIAESFGHHLVPVLPSLCGLHCTDFQKEWAGVRQQGRITVRTQKGETASDCGELQLTDYGISGIPVFQVSRLASAALAEGQQVTAELNFRPRETREELRAFLDDRMERFPSRTAAELLCGIFPPRLIQVMVHRAGISPDGRLTDGPRKERLMDAIQKMEIRITGTNPISQAQCAAGGIRLSEIDPGTMESRLVPGLYLTGEMLDADGICGGYNLQWAWATGTLAGRAVSGGKDARQRLRFGSPSDREER
ncbi:MAG: aminoacetone oxidase family FAD-binding enzyme [Lachnospiraceae bacterium]|jgi:predicted Rossmann fold flavoprotein